MPISHFVFSDCFCAHCVAFSLLRLFVIPNSLRVLFSVCSLRKALTYLHYAFRVLCFSFYCDKIEMRFICSLCFVARCMHGLYRLAHFE